MGMFWESKYEIINYYICETSAYSLQYMHGHDGGNADIIRRIMIYE